KTDTAGCANYTPLKDTGEASPRLRNRPPKSKRHPERSASGGKCSKRANERGAERPGFSLPCVICLAFRKRGPLGPRRTAKRDRMVGVRFDPADRNSILVRRYVEGQAAAAATKAH